MGLRRGDSRATADRRDAGRVTDGVEANARMTGTLGLILFVLFALEGLTILGHVGSQLPWHVFLGMMLVPAVLVKTASTSYRIYRYYTGDPAYLRKGPPAIVLRLLGPLVIATTYLVIVSGVALLVSGGSHPLGVAHKVSFVLWFGAMAIHVLGHLRETPTLASVDYRPGRQPLAGATARRLLMVTILVTGVLLGAWSLSGIGANWHHVKVG